MGGIKGFLGQSDDHGGDLSAEDKGVKSFIDGLIGVLDLEGSDLVLLVDSGYAGSDKLSNGDNLGGSVSHGSEDDLGGALLVELGQDVLGVVGNGSRDIDSDLVLLLLLFGSDLGVCFCHI